MSQKHRPAAIDGDKVCKHLAAQLARILPVLMHYTRNNRGLELSIGFGDQPWRLILVWKYRGKKPGEAWQKKIFDRIFGLLENSNLFIHAGDLSGSAYVLELRVDNYNDFLLRVGPDDIVVPRFNDLVD